MSTKSKSKPKSRVSKSNVKKQGFPRWAMAVVILAIAGLGVFVVYSSFAASSAQLCQRYLTRRLQTDDFNTPRRLPVLRQGSQGTCVRTLQYRLRNFENISVGVDGAFGPNTRNAVITFQRRNQLTADGIVGPTTWRVLLRR